VRKPCAGVDLATSTTGEGAVGGEAEAGCPELASRRIAVDPSGPSAGTHVPPDRGTSVVEGAPEAVGGVGVQAACVDGPTAPSLHREEDTEGEGDGRGGGGLGEGATGDREGGGRKVALVAMSIARAHPSTVLQAGAVNS
jgi:hypothetical protein